MANQESQDMMDTMSDIVGHESGDVVGASMLVEEPEVTETWSEGGEPNETLPDGHVEVKESLVVQFCQTSGVSARDAKWYLKDSGGDLQLAGGRFLVMKEFSVANDCRENDAWWYLKKAEWSVEHATLQVSAVVEFSARSGCSERDAWRFLQHADWSMQRALDEFSKRNNVYYVACPYNQHGECDRAWPITRGDLNCQIARCGINRWRGTEYQFPKHGSRAKVLSHLQIWPGKKWEGWPGEVYGCGRPFGFPSMELLEVTDAANPCFGKFLTWDDMTAGTLEEILVADPSGDYSRVTPEEG